MADMYFENLPNTTTPLNKTNLDKLNDVKVSTTQPTTGEKVWIKRGKNTFNNSLKPGLWTSQGKIGTNDSGFYTVVEITGGLTYTISKKNTTGGIYCTTTADYPVAGINQIDSWQGQVGIKSLTYQTSNSAKYLFIGLFGGNPTETEKAQCIENLMVEQGSTATSYEAYIQPTIYVKNNNNVYEKQFTKNVLNRSELILSDYFDTIDANQVVKVGHVVQVFFRAHTKSAIPEDRTFARVPYIPTMSIAIPISTSGRYAMGDFKFSYMNANASYLRGNSIATNKWIQACFTYITTD